MTFTLLDTYCKAGGASRGYAAAGFEVVGVDIEPQKNYPYRFIQADAVEYIRAHGHEYDAIHASPPCQHHSSAGRLSPHYSKHDHPNLIPATREALKATGKPYVIENVAGARPWLIDPVVLYGRMFGLKVAARPRLFEVNFPMIAPLPCRRGKPIPPAGRGKNEDGEFALTSGGITGVGKAERHAGMGYAAPVMTNAELNQSIPPAFAEYIGRMMMQTLTGERPYQTELALDWSCA